jgi:hypothetical protein
MSIVGSTGNNLNLLTKKMLGLSNINGKYFNDSLGSEIDAKTKIFSSNQLFSQHIPSTAPPAPGNTGSDFQLIGSATSGGIFTQNSSAVNTVSNGTIFQSKQYPWIQYASQVPLSNRLRLSSFVNPLMRTMILYANTGYDATLFNNGTNKYPSGTKIPGYSAIATQHYIIDSDAGVLYITNADFQPSTFGTLYLSFYY